MTKIKVSELTGSLLDFWVARAINELEERGWGIVWNPNECLIFDGEEEIKWSPSTDRSQGYAVVEQYGIDPDPMMTQEYDSDVWKPEYWSCFLGNAHGDGDTLLLAAMRCFVAFHFGDEIEIEEVQAC